MFSGNTEMKNEQRGGESAELMADYWSFCRYSVRIADCYLIDCRITVVWTTNRSFFLEPGSVCSLSNASAALTQSYLISFCFFALGTEQIAVI